MPSDVIATKTVNFLVAITAARVSPVIGSVVSGYQRHYGGVWVGGRAVLTPATLEIGANYLNRKVQKGELDIVIQLADIVEVNDLPGFVTKIVEVVTPVRAIKLRSWGARAFAQQIREAASAAR